MCFPMLGAVVGLAMSGLSAVASISAKDQQYQQQVAQYQANVTNSEAADRDNQNALTLRQEQEQQQAGQKIQQQNVAGAVKSAQVSASAAGGNVAGLSVDNLIADVHNTLDTNRGILDTNYKNTAAQLQSQKDASVDQDQSRINSLAVPVAPDPTGDILSAAGGGLKAFTSAGGAQSSGTNIGLNLNFGM